MPNSNDQKNVAILKAGALMCPVCCVEFIEVEVDFDIDGTVLRNIKVLRCPICQEEHFTPDQLETIEERLRKETEP
jgi:hypothetical protein